MNMRHGSSPANRTIFSPQILGFKGNLSACFRLFNVLNTRNNIEPLTLIDLMNGEYAFIEIEKLRKEFERLSKRVEELSGKLADTNIEIKSLGSAVEEACRTEDY
jgi:ribosome-binding ATPase YchF (GTP1/OBG family)